MLRRCTPSRPFCSALLALRRRPPLLQPRRAIGRHVAGLWQGVGPAPALIAQSRPAGPAMQPTAGRLGLSRPAGSRLRRSPPLQPAPLPTPPRPPPPPPSPVLPQVLKVGTSSLLCPEHATLSLASLARLCEAARDLIADGARVPLVQTATPPRGESQGA